MISGGMTCRLADINPHTLKELKHFFKTYKALKGKDEQQYVGPIEGFAGKNDAVAAFQKACAAYEAKYGKK